MNIAEHKCSYTTAILFTVILKLYILFIIFNGIRESLEIPLVFSMFLTCTRETLLYFLVFGSIFFKKDLKVPGKCTVFFLILVFLPACVSLFMNYYDFGIVLFHCYWIFRSFLFVIVLLNSNCYLVVSDNNLIRYIVIISFLLFIVTLVVYYEFNHLIVNKNEVNLIGLGNSSIQSGTYVVALILCINYRPFTKEIVNVFFELSFIFATILTVTSTAIVAVFIVLFLFLVHSSERKHIVFISLISITLFLLLAAYLRTHFELILLFIEKKMVELFQLLEKFVTLSNEKTLSTSFGERERQINAFYNRLTPINTILGMGDFSIRTKETAIENLYIGVLSDYGISGILFLVLSMLHATIKSIKTIFRKKSAFQLIAILTFAVYGMTLHTILLFNFVGMYIILFYFAFWKEKNMHV